MGKRFWWAVFLAFEGLLVPGSAWGQTGPQALVPANPGGMATPSYSYNPFVFTPVNTGMMNYPPSINYPVYASPLYTPSLRSTPPSINYPAYYRVTNNPLALPSATLIPQYPAATTAVNVNVPVNPSPALTTGLTAPPANPVLEVPGQLNWMENLQLTSSLAGNRQQAYPQSRGNQPPAARPQSNAWIDVRLPANAELWFEGVKTKQTGPVRRFESPKLSPGKEFVYNFRATWTENGKKINQQHQLRISAGDWYQVDLGPTWSEIISVGGNSGTP